MNKNCLKQWLLENRIFGGLNNFLHQHRSVVYSVRTSCESSKHTGVKVQEFRVECSIIFFQMSNHFSFIGAHHNCIWIIGIIRFAFEKNFLSITHSHVIIIPTSDSEFLSKDVWNLWKFIQRIIEGLMVPGLESFGIGCLPDPKNINFSKYWILSSIVKEKRGRKMVPTSWFHGKYSILSNYLFVKTSCVSV